MLQFTFSNRSGLEQDDMRIMYKYLVTSLFPTIFDSEVCDFSQ